MRTASGCQGLLWHRTESHVSSNRSAKCFPPTSCLVRSQMTGLCESLQFPLPPKPGGGPQRAGLLLVPSFGQEPVCCIRKSLLGEAEPQSKRSTDSGELYS